MPTDARPSSYCGEQPKQTAVNQALERIDQGLTAEVNQHRDTLRNDPKTEDANVRRVAARHLGTFKAVAKDAVPALTDVIAKESAKAEGQRNQELLTTAARGHPEGGEVREESGTGQRFQQRGTSRLGQIVALSLFAPTLSSGELVC
jgi:hypothetical protein